MTEPIILRDWQQEAFEKFKANNFRGILNVATGKGKTIFAIHCIQELYHLNPNQKVIIVVPTINLLKQWEKELKKFTSFNNEEIGLFYGEEKKIGKKITISVINSAVKEDRLLQEHNKINFDFLILDECHHYGAKTFSKILELKTKKVLGLSATPERYKDMEGTSKIYSEIGNSFYKLHHVDDLSSIPDFVMWHVAVNFTEKEEEDYMKNSKEVDEKITFLEKSLGIKREDERFMGKIKELAEYKKFSKEKISALRLLKLMSLQAKLKYCAENKLSLIKEIVQSELDNKIIVFNERIEFAERIRESLVGFYPKENIFVVHSNLDKTENLASLEEFRKNKTGILIVAKMVDEGFDVPDASVAIIASFIGNPRQMIQRDGRILRQSDGKFNAKRYALVIKGFEEDKYFSIIKNPNIEPFAIKGRFVEFINSGLVDSARFKENFINFESRIKKNEESYQNYIEDQLTRYEEELTKGSLIDPVETDKRINFFEKNTKSISNKLNDKPFAFPITKKKMNMIQEKISNPSNDPKLEKYIQRTQIEKMNKRIKNNPKLLELANLFPKQFPTIAKKKK